MKTAQRARRLWLLIGVVVIVVIVSVISVQYARAKLEPHYTTHVSKLDFTGNEPYIFLQSYGQGTDGDEIIATPSPEIITPDGSVVVQTITTMHVQYISRTQIVVLKWATNHKGDPWLMYFYTNNALQELTLPDAIKFSEVGPQQITQSPSGRYMFVHNNQDWFMYNQVTQEWIQIDRQHIPKTDHEVTVEWSATDDQLLYANVKDYNDDGSLGNDIARYSYNPEKNTWTDIGITTDYEMQVLPVFFSNRILCPDDNTITYTSIPMQEIPCDQDKPEQYDFKINNPWVGKQSISVTNHKTNQTQKFYIGFSLFEHDTTTAELLGDSGKLLVYTKRELGIIDIPTENYAKLRDIIHWAANDMRLQDVVVLPQFGK